MSELEEALAGLDEQKPISEDKLQDLRDIGEKLIRKYVHEPKWLWQRLTRGFSDRDTWSFDDYLAKVIFGGLKELRKRDLSYPSDTTQEEWRETLDEMIEGFKIIVNDPDAAMDPEAEQALDLFSRFFFDLWD